MRVKSWQKNRNRDRTLKMTDRTMVAWTDCSHSGGRNTWLERLGKAKEDLPCMGDVGRREPGCLLELPTWWEQLTPAL